MKTLKTINPDDLNQHIDIIYLKRDRYTITSYQGSLKFFFEDQVFDVLYLNGLGFPYNFSTQQHTYSVLRWLKEWGYDWMTCLKHNGQPTNFEDVVELHNKTIKNSEGIIKND